MPRAPAAAATATSGASDEWKSLAAAATRVITALENRAADLRKKSARIVAPKDASRAKDGLRSGRDGDSDTVAGAREILRRLEAHVQSHPHDAAVGAALGKAAVMALEAFEAAQMSVVRRISEVEQTASAAGRRAPVGSSSAAPTGPRRHAAVAIADGGDDEDATEASTLVPSSGGGQQRQTHLEPFQVDVYDDIMRERSREVAELAENIRDIHEIFQHISIMVAEQGEQIDAIEDNVDNAASEVTRGRVELEKSRQLQSANRNIRCYVIGLIFVLGVLFLVAVLYK